MWKKKLLFFKKKSSLPTARYTSNDQVHFGENGRLIINANGKKKKSFLIYLILLLLFLFPQKNPPMFIYQAIGLMSRLFSNSLEDQGSIPGRVIPKIQKMVLAATLLNTQHFKVWI